MLALALGLIVGWQTAGLGNKGQDLRLFDVFALGPWLAILAYQRTPLKDWQRVALLFTAGATISHNGRNWLVERDVTSRS